MHTLARNLNLPASFVEIRHAATHEALPSLSVLRIVAVRALDWLWLNYWSVVGVAAATDGSDAGAERVQILRARLALKRWRQLRRNNPLKELKQGDPSPEGREAFAIIKECVSICKEDEGREALVGAFLEEKALIPAGRKYVIICSSISPVEGLTLATESHRLWAGRSTSGFHYWKLSTPPLTASQITYLHQCSTFSRTHKNHRWSDLLEPTLLIVTPRNSLKQS